MKRLRCWMIAGLLLTTVTAARAQELQISRTTTVRCPVESVTYDWVLIGPNGRIDFQSEADGRQIAFPSTGQWRVVVCTAGGKQFVAEIAGGSTPGPNPNPTPPDESGVPADEFDNVGRLSFRLASEFTDAARAKVAATAAIYKQAGERLADGRFPSVGAAAQWLAVERGRVWEDTADTWNRGWVEPIGKVFDKHVADNETATKFTVASFYLAVAKGLEAVK